MRDIMKCGICEAVCKKKYFLVFGKKTGYVCRDCYRIAWLVCVFTNDNLAVKVERPEGFYDA